MRKPPPSSGSRDPDAQPIVSDAAAAPAPIVLTLRDVNLPPAPAPDAAPVDHGLVRSDVEARPVPWLGDPEAERAQHKASRRAQVRRERQHHTEPEAPASDAPAILVFCAAD